MLNKEKRRAVFNLYRQRTDILCLQETHSTCDQEQEWISDWGNKQVFFCHGTSNSKGVCILFANNKSTFKVKDCVKDCNGHYIILLIETENKVNMLLCCLYAPNQDSPAFFQELENQLVNFDSPKIIIGDFNLVLNTEIDRNGSTRNNVKAMHQLETMMTVHHLVDIWRIRNPEKIQFSWVKKDLLENSPTSRIDMALISKGLDVLCENVLYIPCTKTNHSAMFLAMKDFQSERGKGYWKFNNSLLTNINFVKEVEHELRKDAECIRKSNSNPADQWEKLKMRLQKLLQRKSREVSSTTNLIIANLSELIAYYEENFPLNKNDNKIYEASKQDFDELLLEKSKSLIFRSKVKWMSEGERCTKYFCSLEKARSRSKSCQLIINSNNEEITSNKGILDEQSKFYRELYKADPTVQFNLTNTTNTQVGEEMKQRHEAAFTETDLYRAMKGLKRGRTPGKDGLGIEVYETFWKTLSPFLHNAYFHAFETQTFHNSGMQGILNLIPKKNKDTRYLKNLRPITLLNVDYKIIKKCIATRLAEAMAEIIGHEQTGFMAKRRISTNIRKVLDMIDYYKYFKHKGILVNLDFVKAFDRAETNSVLGSLKFFNFADYLIQWVKILYSDFTIQVQNNGHFSDTIPVTRSVHQGGVASAFLFNILVETLAITMKQNTEICALNLAGKEYLLNQYADDTEIASEDNPQSVEAIFNHLDYFQLQSGLMISYEKTSMYRMGSTNAAVAENYTKKPVAWAGEDFELLGVQISQNSLLEKNYTPLINKATGILNQWKKRHLSLHGKICVVNTLVMSLFVHKMLVLPNMPKCLMDRLTNIIDDFIWNGRRAKIARVKLQQDTRNGGVGLTNLRLREKALKISWINILQNNPESANIAYSLINPTLRDNIFRCNLHKKDIQLVIPRDKSEFWNDVLTAWAEINFDNKTVNGQSVWFNSSIRVDDKPIFIAQCFEKGLMWISQLYPNGKLIGVKAARELYDLNIMQLNQIHSAIPMHWKNELKLTPDCRNITKYDNLYRDPHITKRVYKWLLEEINISLTKTAAKWSNDCDTDVSEGQLVTALKSVYIVTNIPKLRSFQYRLLHRAIVLNKHLQRWGLSDNNACSFCNQCEENFIHVFCECESVRVIWNSISLLCRSLSGCEIRTDAHSIIFNNVTDNPRDVCNFICLATKQYIYRNKCLNKPLSVTEIRNIIYQHKNTEKFLAQCNGHMPKYTIKWKC